ncbi:MAG: IclR family transcriptional regulator [Chloroflexota bacterium]
MKNLELSPPKPLSSNKNPKKDMIGSVQRAFRIIELLANFPDGLNAKQISLELRLNISTCYHLLNTLEHEGYLVKDPHTLQFRASGKITYPTYLQPSPFQIIKHLKPHVKRLKELTEETSYLSVWDGQEIAIAHIVEADKTVLVKSIHVGFIEGNHASALGKAILAYLPIEQIDQYFDMRQLTAYTVNTIPDLGSLKKYLIQVRQKGYALDLCEFMQEVHCIGAPIFDARGNVIASIAISLPAHRSEKNSSFLISNVKQAANSASRTLSILGYVNTNNLLEKEG